MPVMLIGEECDMWLNALAPIALSLLASRPVTSDAGVAATRGPKRTQ
jgi:hypothetical protein